MRNFYSMDGEAIILKEVFDPEVQAAFRDALIDVCKISKSDTGHHQASDRSPVFRDCKTGMDTVTNNPSIDFSCSVIEKSVQKVIEEFNNTPEFTSTCKIVGKNYKRIILACQKISYVCSNYLCPAKVSAGYLACGQHLPPGDREWEEVEDDRIKDENRSSVSFDRIMAQSFCELDSETLFHMKEVAPELIDELRSTGKITDSHMDTLNIPRMEGDEGIEHSSEVYWKGLAGLLTADDTVVKYRDYIQEQKDKKDPVKVAAKKAEANSMKALAKNSRLEAAREKKEADQLAKKKARETEKARWSSMTPGQRKAETLKKRKDKEENRLRDLAYHQAVVSTSGYHAITVGENNDDIEPDVFSINKDQEENSSDDEDEE